MKLGDIDSQKLRDRNPSEWKADRQNAIVIGSVVMSGRNLESTAEIETSSPCESNAPYHHPWCQEPLFLAVVRPILEKGGVELNLRPNLLHDTVLESIVPCVGAAQCVRVGHWHSDTEGALDVKISDSLTVPYGRRYDRMSCAVRRGARRQALAQKRRQNIASLALG